MKRAPTIFFLLSTVFLLAETMSLVTISSTFSPCRKLFFISSFIGYRSYKNIFYSIILISCIFLHPLIFFLNFRFSTTMQKKFYSMVSPSKLGATFLEQSLIVNTVTAKNFHTAFAFISSLYHSMVLVKIQHF